MGAQRAVLAAALAALLAACSGGADDRLDGARPAATDARDTTANDAGDTTATDAGDTKATDAGGTTATDAGDTTVTDAGDTAATGADADRLDGADILDRVRPSLVFVETPLSTGSGIVIAGGYVLTNAHVVDPFGTATATPASGRAEDLKVLGADLFADIAVLGPLQQNVPAVPLDPAVDVRTGSDVFLVGFPGDVEAGDDPEPTISKGILSRTRRLPEFGLTYLQTDAAIGAGQSGGALVDQQARVVGISSLSFADEFALALGAGDAAAAAQHVIDGQATGYAPLPEGPAVQRASFTLAWRYDSQVLVVPATADDRTVDLTVPDDPDVTVQLYDVASGDGVMNAPAVQEELAFDSTLTPEDLGTPTAPVAAGTWELRLPAGDVAVALIGARRDAAALAVSATAPFVVLPDDDQERPLAVGDRVEATLGAYEPNDTYVLPLAAGQHVEVSARSPAADMWFKLATPGQWVGQAEMVDDTGGGLYGLDAEQGFTADATGSYRLMVGDWDGISVGYVVEVK